MIKQLFAALLALCVAAAFAASVDANKATQAELESVKGVGPAISGKILEERKKGQFKDWNDLIDRVKGVGEGNAAKFSAEGLTVGGASFKGVAAAAPKADAKPASAAAVAAAPTATKAAAPAPAATPAAAKATTAAPATAPAAAATTAAAAKPAAAEAKPDAKKAAAEAKADKNAKADADKVAKADAKKKTKDGESAKPKAASAASAPKS